jgi:hypothetical protein
VIYQALATVTRPVLRLTRFVTPRVVLDRHLGLVAILLVGLAWFLVLVEKQALCVDGGLRETNCAALTAEYVKRCGAGQVAYCEVLRRNGLLADQPAIEQVP